MTESPTLGSPLQKQRFDDRSQTKISIALRTKRSNGKIEGAGSDDDPPSLGYNHFTSKSKRTINWSRIEKLSGVLSSPDFIQRFGSPVLLEISSVYMAVSTERGFIVGFNYRQSLEFVLGAEAHRSGGEGSDVDDGNGDGNDSLVTCIAFSSDSTHLAAGHSDGSIAIWNTSEREKSVGKDGDGIITPVSVIAPISQNDEQMGLKEGHLKNTIVNNLGFINNHHSQLYSSDVTGIVCFHLGVKLVLRKKFVSTRILGNDLHRLTIKACEILPMGTSEQITDHLGVLAVMTNKVLVVVSILSLNNPHSTKLITHYTTPQPPSSTMASNGCLSWYPCMKKLTILVENAKLAYSSDNQLIIIEVDNNSMPGNLIQVISDLKDKDKSIPILPLHKMCKWKGSEEPIVNIKWVTLKILCAFSARTVWTFHYNSKTGLTVIGEESSNFNGYAAIQVFREKLMVLGGDERQIEVILGSLVNWADTLMDFLSNNEHLKALNTAIQFYNLTPENESFLILVGLPTNTKSRQELVRPYLLEIMKTSTPFIFLNQSTASQTANLCIYFDILSDLPKIELDILEDIFEIFKEIGRIGFFFKTLEPYLINSMINSLPPVILKELVTYYTGGNQGDTLTEILCTLNIETLDIDLTIQLCRQYQLRDALIYIWNYLLNDYETPFMEYLKEISNNKNGEDLSVFTYMSYILTGRQYPTDRLIDQKFSSTARDCISDLLFKGIDENGSIFPNLVIFLKYQSFEMLSTLNEFFEDSSLNDDNGGFLNRQYIIEALLDVFETYSNEFNETDKCQMAIFIGRNYPKYPQFIRLSESTIERVIQTLCSNTNENIVADCELALQSLIGECEPDFDAVLVGKLKAAKFYDVLMGVYRTEGKYSKVLETWIEGKKLKLLLLLLQESISILEDLFRSTTSSNLERLELISVIKANFTFLSSYNTASFVRLINKYVPSLHLWILNECKEGQLNYIVELLSVSRLLIIDSKILLKYLEILLDDNSPDINHFINRLIHEHDSMDWAQIEGILEKHDSIENIVLVKMHRNEHNAVLSQILNYIGENARMFKPEKLETLLGLSMEICINYEEIIDIENADGDDSTFDGELYQNERMWLQLINFCIERANEVNSNSEEYNKAVQACFKRISSSSSSSSSSSLISGRKERSLLTIFNKFLDGNQLAANLSNVRGILQEVFVLYSYENEMLRICLRLLHSGISKSMKIIRAETLKGMSILGKSCTSCGKIMWGGNDEVSEDHWLAWEDLVQETVNISFREKSNERKEKYKNCSLVFFACGHGYHTTCWEGIGKGSCAICTS